MSAESSCLKAPRIVSADAPPKVQHHPPAPGSRPLSRRAIPSPSPRKERQRARYCVEASRVLQPAPRARVVDYCRKHRHRSQRDWRSHVIRRVLTGIGLAGCAVSARRVHSHLGHASRFDAARSGDFHPAPPTKPVTHGVVGEKLSSRRLDGDRRGRRETSDGKLGGVAPPEGTTSSPSTSDSRTRAPRPLRFARRTSSSSARPAPRCPWPR